MRTDKPMGYLSTPPFYRAGRASLATAMILFCQAASAATDSIPAAITALVPAACDIAADGVSFGVYTGKQVDVESTISISCTRTTGWNIGLNAGLGPDATVNARKLVRGTSTMSYGLFSDTAKTVNWGETIGGDTVSGTGTGTAQTVTVYARLPCGQFVKPGAYFDTIVATITY